MRKISPKQWRRERLAINTKSAQMAEQTRKFDLSIQKAAVVHSCALAGREESRKREDVKNYLKIDSTSARGDHDLLSAVSIEDNPTSSTKNNFLSAFSSESGKASAKEISVIHQSWPREKLMQASEAFSGSLLPPTPSQ